MSSPIPEPAAIAVSDMLDDCARIQPGEEVLLLAYQDGLHGGDNIGEAAFKVGEVLIHDEGRPTALDLPEVKAVAAE